jgi:ABC-2 type transport system ATP-binding protein
MLQIKNLSKKIGLEIILDNVSLEFNKGGIYALLGPNGAGKSTLINCITGLTKVSKGEIVYDNVSFRGQKELMHSIGYVPQEIALSESLTIEENIKIWSGLYREPKNSFIKYQRYLIDRLGLSQKLNVAVRHLSGGMKRRVNIICSLIHNPDYVFFDEPTVGIDPQSRNMILDFIIELKKANKTIIYISHYMEEIEKICDHIYILDQGTLILNESKENIQKEKRNDGKKIEQLFFELTGTKIRE